MADYRLLAQVTAQKYGLDPEIFLRQIQQESGWDPNALSPAGAKGIAQLMPVHWKAVDPSDPVASLDYAARLMAGYVQQYGDYATALAAYNAGPGAVAQYGGVPPFDETKRYVKNILGSGTSKGGSGMADPFGQLVQEHGGIIGAIPINPTIEQSIGDTKFSRPNPNPQYRYVFADGTYVIGLNANYDRTTQPTYADIQIVDPGTAMGAKAPKETAPTVRQGADKGDYQYNPDTGKWEPAPGMPAPPDVNVKPTMTPPGSIDPTDRYYYVWDPGSNEYVAKDNPKFDQEMYDLNRQDAELKRQQLLAQIAASNRSGQGSPSEWAKLMWEQQRYPEETAYSRDQDRLKREMDEKKYGLDAQKASEQVAQWRAQNEQAQQNLASELGNWWSRDRLAASQWALNPAWNGVPPGFEANGPYGKLLQMGGVQPQSVQLSTINFDPIEAWRAAQQQVGVK